MDSDLSKSGSQSGTRSSLARATGSDPIDHEQAVTLVISLCEKTMAAHEKGLAYGGLSPHNLMIDENLDLTIALEPSSGTLAEIDDSNRDYIAPELLSGEECNPLCDVYSAGRILYRLLTGITPRGDTLPPPSTTHKSPLVLDTLIKNACKPDPASRISSVGKLANDLRQTAQLRPVIKRPEAPVSRVPRQPQAPPASASIKPGKPVEIPWALITKVALALLLLLVIIRFASNFGEDVEEGMTAAPYNPDRDRELAERPDPFARDQSRPRVLPMRKPGAKPRAEPLERLRDSLPRLKAALHSGRRDELPPEAIRRNDSSYALWNRSMTWTDARAFAEAHGAHLAILTDREERRWVREQFDLRYPVWLGAGKGAHESWQWLDGTPMPTAQSVGNPDDRYLALNKNGIIIPADPKRKCDVLLEWRDDGQNPGTEREQLQRVRTLALSGAREKLLQGQGLPIGTRTFGDSHFYAVRREMITWDEALDFAAVHGAYLAVPSSMEEHQWICEHFWGYLGTGQGLWLGGVRAQANQPWRWINREPWHGAGLPENASTHPLFDRLLLQGGGEPGTGRWTMVEGNRRKAPGILLEWSTPGEHDPGEAVRVVSSDTWIETLNRKTQQVVGSDLSAFDWDKRKLVERYDRELGKLISARKSSIKNALGRPGQNNAALREELAAMDNLEQLLARTTEKGQILPDVPTERGSLNTLQNKAVGALAALEDKYDTKIKDRQEAYRTRVEAQSRTLQEQGHLEKAADLRGVLRPLRPDLKAFLRMLYPANTERATLPWEPREQMPAKDE